jgi:DNA-binding transcriptional ArsR family regulator
MNTQQLIQEVTQLHADICSALADPTRILLLYALVEKPCTVNELTAVVKISQPATSRHLKVLRERGLVNTTRLGQSVEYSLNDPRIIQALDLLRDVLRGRLIYRASLAETDGEPLPAVDIAESIHKRL